MFQEGSDKPVQKSIKPYSHISTLVPLSVLTDNIKLPPSIPPELLQYLRYLYYLKYLI